MRKVPNTTIAEFLNTVGPDETAHYEPYQTVLSGFTVFAI